MWKDEKESMRMDTLFLNRVNTVMPVCFVLLLIAGTFMGSVCRAGDQSEKDQQLSTADGFDGTDNALGGRMSGAFASTSPGGEILITSDMDGDYELYTMRADGAILAKLTSNTSKDSRAKWSPDGTMIAFVRDDKEVWIIKADGTGERFIRPGSSVDFSPDGKKLVISDYSGSFYGGDALYVFDLSSHEALKITTLTASELNPDWYPNQKRIVYTHYFFFYGVYYKNIHTISPDGTKDADLTGCDDWNICFADSPKWSPDGRKIAFQLVPGKTGDYNIYVMNADGSGKKRLTTGYGGEISPVWSPGGQYLLFCGYDGNSNIYLMNANGSNPKLIRDDGSNTYPLDWHAEQTVRATAVAGTGYEGGSPGRIQVSRTGKLDTDLLVAYKAGGSATEGVDYQKLSGKVKIPGGKSSSTIVIRPIENTSHESPETVTITLLPGEPYSIGQPGKATVRIVDND